MVVSAKTYEQVALEDVEGHWELVCGRLRQKPGMTFAHNSVVRALAGELIARLDPREYQVDAGTTRVRLPSGSYYIPDLTVIPVALARQGLQEQAGRLEVYEAPLPLIVEVWPPSTGDYDVEIKLQEYQRRGDAEIWRIHPHERRLTAWRLQPGGGYSETIYRQGAVSPAALPNVRIEVDALFEP